MLKSYNFIADGTTSSLSSVLFELSPIHPVLSITIFSSTAFWECFAAGREKGIGECMVVRKVRDRKGEKKEEGIGKEKEKKYMRARRERRQLQVLDAIGFSPLYTKLYTKFNMTDGQRPRRHRTIL